MARKWRERSRAHHAKNFVMSSKSSRCQIASQVVQYCTWISMAGGSPIHIGTHNSLTPIHPRNDSIHTARFFEVCRFFPH